MKSASSLPLAQLGFTVAGLSVQEREHAWLCRVMLVTGFGGRRDGEAILLLGSGTEARIVGSLLGGSADTVLAEAPQPGKVCVLSIPVGDREAVAAGLACGGTAEVLIEPLRDVPESVWAAVSSRARVTIVSELPPDDPQASTKSLTAANPGGFDKSADCALGARSAEESKTHVRVCVALSDVELGDPAGLVNLKMLTGAATLAEAVADQARKGTVRAQIISDGQRRFFCEVVAPIPHLVVLGVSALATAICNQASLLGWTFAVIDERTETGLADGVASARALGQRDGLVVLSHDLDASCSALQAAANHGPESDQILNRLGRPYMGALGSRHTQAARAERLATLHHWSPEQLSTIHGPIGLNIGASNPEETALAIVAEMLAYLNHRPALSLRAQVV